MAGTAERVYFQKSVEYLNRKIMSPDTAQAYSLLAIAEALHRLADAAEATAHSPGGLQR